MSEQTVSDQSVRVSFAHDHERLDQFLETYRELKHSDFAQAKQAFREFKFGLQRHIIWEETILFPLFEEKTGLYDQGPTAVMRADHREIGRRLEALHDKVRRQDIHSEAEEEALLQALHAHNRKEENILYPAIDRLTSEEDRAAAFQAMADLPEDAYRTCCGGHH